MKLWENDAGTSVMLFLAIVLLVVCGAVWYRRWRKQRVRAFGRSVEGEIIAFRDGDVRLADGPRWPELSGKQFGKVPDSAPEAIPAFYNADVAYTVDGKEYILTQAVAKAYRLAHDAGEMVTVWYDPARPKKAMLETAEPGERNSE